MLVLYHQAAATFPGVLPAAGLLEAALLSLDNFISTQIFFDAAECFHLRFGIQVEGPFGASLVFVSRFLMDLVFIKLAVQLLNAAYFRAQGLGRGEDMLFSVKQHIEAGDVPRVQGLCQQVGDSLRDAVDTLCRYHEEGGDQAAMAWRCLMVMKDYAIPYLKTRHRSATGNERQRIAKLIKRLASPAAKVEKPPPTRPWLLIALAAGQVFGVAGSFLLTGAAALVVAVLMTALTSWMLAGSRGWIDRLVRWHLLLPSTPDRLVRLQLRWALCLLPLLVVTWSRLFQFVAGLTPEIFSGAALGEVNYPSMLVFVLENLLHTQIFADTFDVYGVRIADIRQEGGLGGLLTFLFRLVVNVGIIELVVSFGMVWFNRVFRKFAVSPNAELALRKEVHECGPQAAGLVGYHLREVRGFLVEQMKRQKNEAMLVALAASGFFKDVQADRVTGKETAETEGARHNNLGNALAVQGRLDEAVAEYQAAREIQEQLVREGRDDLRNELARTRNNLGIALDKQGRLDEAVAEYQAAREIYERLVREGRDDLRNDLAATRMNLGNALAVQGRLDEAVAEYQAAREIYEWLVGEGRDDLRNALAATRMNLGIAFWQQGRLDEAVAEYQDAREIYERLVREGRDDLRNDLAMTRMNLGGALRQQGRLDEAVAEYQDAREIRERLVREGRADLRNDLARTRNNLGTALWKQGRLDEAVAEYQAAREIRERLVCEGQFQVVAGLAMCWFNALIAATKISQQEAISVSRPAFSFLRELLPQRTKLSPAAFTKIGDFLRLAQKSNVCADEAAALAVQFTPG